jgi:hypothetical protein
MTLLGHVRGGQIVPDQPIVLPEGAPVRIELMRSELASDWFDQDALQWANEEGDSTISLEEVRRRLSKLQGSLSDVVIAERGEY